MPMRQHDDDAAFDLFVPNNVDLQPGRQVVDLKFSLEIPKGYAATIQPRSGFSAKGVEDITGCRRDADVLHGIVDEDYRGSIGVLVRSEDYFIIKKGTRLAQMLIGEYRDHEFEEVDDLSSTSRGEGGFGHTGTK